MKITKSIYLVWLHVAWFLRKKTGIKAYGIGWVATKVGLEFGFTFNGVPFTFTPKAARSYCLLPAGIANEPETHQFLEQVLRHRHDVTFIDVGASIGEFAIPMAYDSRVAKVVAFEPNPATADALRASAASAPFGKIEIIESAVGARSGITVFNLHNSSPTSASLLDSQSCEDTIHIELKTIDESHQVWSHAPAILLIDIEGGELEALRGGLSFISDQHPLIIFEYNATTRSQFELSEAAALLGKAYKIYRLRSEDGRLDSFLAETWNVVGLPNQGPWADLLDRQELFAE